MPDWTPLHATILRADPNARHLALIEQIESWLDQPLERALELCRDASPDEDRAREVNALLNLVIRAYRRDLVIADGPAGVPRLQEIAAAYAAGTLATAERRIWERASLALQLWLAQRRIFPAITTAAPPTAEEEKLRAALSALQPRSLDAQQYALPQRVSPERMEALAAVLADFRSLAASAATERRVHADICFFAAHAAYALGRGWRLLGRTERAARAYAEAAEFFRQGGQLEQAAAAEQTARGLGYAVRSDIDAASVADLRELLAGETDALTRARAHARLAALASDANDVFDAAEWAEKACGNLVEAGFPDPELQPMDVVLDAWIEAACRAASPADALSAPRLLLEIGGIHQSILLARQARWIGSEPDRAERASRALSALNTALREVAAQPALAHAAVKTKLARYVPLLAQDPAPPEVAADSTLAERMAALSERMNAIQAAANEADAKRDQTALAELQRRAAECLAEARAIGAPPTIGLASYIDAYVRLRAGDIAGAVEGTQAGEAALLAGMSATPEAMAAHPSFDLLLMLRRVRCEAVGVRGDMPALVALAEETVRLIEARRYRISDPFQQGAFLANRTQFYEMVAFGSFKLGRWDGLLSAMELVKARAALLNRLAPPPAVEQEELAKRLEAATAALATAPEDSEVRLVANEQRRLLLSLRAIARHQAGRPDAVPTLDIAAVQAALAPDEAVVAWMWVGRSVLLVLALDSKQVHAERVVLSDADRELLDSYVDAVRSDRVNTRALDGTVTRLVAAVLPPQTRAFVGTARRLILSPHRALHLLPFHAATFDGHFLIERAAIRYVPNLGSLLVPWSNADADGASRDQRGLLAIGIGDFAVPGEQWDRLADAEDEARSVAEVWSARGLPIEIRIGREASVAALRALAPRLIEFRGLHLATHGSSVFAKEAENDPYASRLILQDGALDALTIGQLRLGAEVVLLSACHSGQRALGGRGLSELPGDDVFGLQAALFEAGALSVIGAVWPADDRSTRLIMTALHQGMTAGIAPELALQQAIAGYLQRPDAKRGIYFWAPLFISSIGRIAETGR